MRHQSIATALEGDRTHRNATELPFTGSTSASNVHLAIRRR
jgi:hypothetical protein